MVTGVGCTLLVLSSLILSMRLSLACILMSLFDRFFLLSKGRSLSSFLLLFIFLLV